MNAAEHGYAPQHSFNEFCDYGHGAIHDCSAVLRWYLSKPGDLRPLVLYRFGYLHEVGLGVPQNYKEATVYYLKAAELEHVVAQSRLGYLYEKGLRVQQQDYSTSMYWYSQAAG
jgi:TPR repeat protein